MINIQKYFTLTEAPHISRIICPSCAENFALDAQIELWKMSPEEKTGYITDYFKYQLLPLDCPRCHEELIYDDKAKKTNKYYEIINKLPAHVKTFIQNVRKYGSQYSSKVKIDEDLTFKNFSNKLDIIDRK